MARACGRKTSLSEIKSRIEKWVGVLVCLALVVGSGGRALASESESAEISDRSGIEGESAEGSGAEGGAASGADAAEGGADAAEGESAADDEAASEYSVAQPLENLSLYATAAVLLDAGSGRVLYEKNGFTPLAMASTTKIMTCIVALENVGLEEEADVSAYAASMPKVKLYVSKGEKYTIKDLLHSLMLESHNDSAVVIAEHIGKRRLSSELQSKSAAEYTVEESKQAVAAFADLMNEKARELGCADTWFITPNGLDATETIHMTDGTDQVKEHTTTAADLATIMAYCIGKSPEKETFLEITRTASYSFAANGRSYSCNNHNAFLNMMDGALSGKTGFTNKAGYCYVGALTRGDKTFTVALLACGWPNNKTYKWSDTRELMEYGLEHYEYHEYGEIPIEEQKLQAIPVQNGCTRLLGDTAYTELAAAKTAEGGQLLREDEQYTVKYTIKSILQAPVESGTEVGCIEYLLGNAVCERIPVITTDTVEVITLSWCIEQIINRYLM